MFNFKGPKRTSHSRGSLNPEFDAANMAALSDPDVVGPPCAVMCEECFSVKDWDPKLVGRHCRKGGCSGWYVAIDEDWNVVRLPNELKTGKKSGSGYLTQNDLPYTGGTTNSAYKSCNHPGEKVIFEWGGKKLFAAKGQDLIERSCKWELILDLAGVAITPATSNFNFLGVGPKKLKDALIDLVYKDTSKYPEVLRLNWSDMGIPPVGLPFWLKMWEMLPERTVMCCVGGHGRTGTCLASLMISAGIDYYSAVQTVRTEHCERAIESLQQEKYLHALYMDVLKHELENGGDAVEIGKDLEYAASHVPNDKSSYGEIVKEEPKKSGGLAAVPKRHTMIWLKEDGTAQRRRTFGSVDYVLECIEPTCNKYGCMDTAHIGWIDYEHSDTKWELEGVTG